MTYTEKELKEILDKHIRWLRQDGVGWEDLRADLRWADLQGADLSRANLRGADLYGANLYGANLYGAKGVPFIPSTCPDEGGFIGWKKAQGMIVKLYIPEDARRSSATGRKCRCDKAVVLEIQSTDGKEVYVAEAEVKSNYDENFVYKVGETVSVSNFDEDRFNECAPGIHFFVNRQEAVDY